MITVGIRYCTNSNVDLMANMMDKVHLTWDISPSQVSAELEEPRDEAEYLDQIYPEPVSTRKEPAENLEGDQDQEVPEELDLDETPEENTVEQEKKEESEATPADEEPELDLDAVPEDVKAERILTISYEDNFSEISYSEDTVSSDDHTEFHRYFEPCHIC